LSNSRLIHPGWKSLGIKGGKSKENRISSLVSIQVLDLYFSLGFKLLSKILGADYLCGLQNSTHGGDTITLCFIFILKFPLLMHFVLHFYSQIPLAYACFVFL
jgi:hypothetical protein